jgi:hypothetical protein
MPAGPPSADSRTAARFYVWHSTFWIDLVATLPFFAQLALMATGSTNAAIRFFFMLRLLRIFRCLPTQPSAPGLRPYAVWHGLIDWQSRT